LAKRCDPLDDDLTRSASGEWVVEQLTEGVVSVEWTLPGADETLPRVHLHIGDGTRPPVDLAFDKRDGRLLGVQVILQDQAVAEEHVFGAGLLVEDGVLVADLTPWRGEEQLLDHVFTPTVAWEPTGTLAVRIARTSGLPAKECVVDRVRAVLDANGFVLGVRMTGFSESDIAIVTHASVDAR